MNDFDFEWYDPIPNNDAIRISLKKQLNFDFNPAHKS